MTIVLPTEPSKPVTELGKQTILLYGSPKLGKSSFASKAPGSLFFECEPGLNHLEVFKIPTYKWEDFLDARKLVAKGDHNFKTIVIDTVDNAFKMCSDYSLWPCHSDSQILTAEFFGSRFLKMGPLVVMTVTLEVRSSLENIAFFSARPTGFEPATSGSTGNVRIA